MTDDRLKKWAAYAKALAAVAIFVLAFSYGVASDGSPLALGIFFALVFIGAIVAWRLHFESSRCRCNQRPAMVWGAPSDSSSPGVGDGGGASG
jgi:hypothetical protein